MTAASFNFINFRSFAGAVALVLVFCAHYLVLEAIFLSYARRSTNRLQLKRRLATEGSDQEQQRALARIRQRRGLSASGQHFLPVAWLDRLIVLGIPTLFMEDALRKMEAGLRALQECRCSPGARREDPEPGFPAAASRKAAGPACDARSSRPTGHAAQR